MRGCICGLLFLMGPPGWMILFMIMFAPPPLDRKRDPLNSYANTFYGKH